MKNGTLWLSVTVIMEETKTQEEVSLAPDPAGQEGHQGREEEPQEVQRRLRRRGRPLDHQGQRGAHREEEGKVPGVHGLQVIITKRQPELRGLP